MNAVIQYQHIHALLGLVLLHELEQFPVKIPKIHHIDRLIVRRQQRDHAVRIGILDHKKRLPGIISRMDLYKCMIIIQGKIRTGSWSPDIPGHTESPPYLQNHR